MSIEVELIQFVKSIAAFSDPIRKAYSPETDLIDPKVLARMAYNQVGQQVLKGLNVSSPPYLYWTGPFKTDLGQCSTDFAGTAKADFWFWLNATALTDAMIWGDAIQKAVASALPGIIRLTNYRLVSAIFIDRHPVPNNQTNLTGQEFAMNQCAIGYTFGYQPQSS